MVTEPSIKVGLPNSYCVVGDPIAHSLSPKIHSWFAESEGKTFLYHKIRVAKGSLKSAIEEFMGAGGKGMNVTVPLKEEAYSISDVRSDRAVAAEAANFLSFGDNGEITADNTDGYGLITDISRNLNMALSGKVIFLLGAGGAARGVLDGIAAQSPSLLQLSNRTLSKVEKLSNLIPKSCPREIVPWGQMSTTQPDIIINATSLSLTGDLPKINSSVFALTELVYDMVYSSKPTSFMELASRQGAKNVSDGLGMLVEQAAESYRLWNGTLPCTENITDRLRSY
ncbi:MAG: shikimate dehydrogenase [Gammaproteobacteria bacterium]